MYEDGVMEARRVELHNWTGTNQPGGWVMPYGDPVNHWTVSKIHAIYDAPEIKFGSVDEQGRELKRRFRMRAYLVDLDGSDALGLPDLERVMLHQRPPTGLWHLRRVDDAYLARVERYRVA